tara:strand:+ start:599 stop:979 length:381 start_codon:yes stop_codon:yes gene_type:complete
MISIFTTIQSLVPKDYAFVLRGEPTNEAEFLEAYRPLTGVDSNNTAIENEDASTWTITWADIVAKKAELEKEYTDNEYQRKRTGIDGTTDGYPPIGEQLDYIYHNGIDKWKTDMVDPVKAKYPKPS